MMAATSIRVEVVYARRERQWIVAVELPGGSTLADALQASRLAELNPELAAAGLTFGIWGRQAALNAILREGDRVEIYRPLVADPKSARRARADQRRSKEKSLSSEDG